MLFYPNDRTVENTMNRLPLELQEKYKETQLDRIYIDGELITGYFEYSFLEEKSYAEQPTRASDGTIRDLNNYTTFLTPRVIIRYNMMNIEDYRKLMKMLKTKNTFTVECYDIVEDKRVSHEMYFAPPSMPIIYQQYLMALGIQEYTIELIGTNAQDYYEVYYDFNLPGELELEYNSLFLDTPRGVEGQGTYNRRYTIGGINAYIPLPGAVGDSRDSISGWAKSYNYILTGWSTRKDGGDIIYQDDMAYFLNKKLYLYAQWEKTS